MADPCAGRGGRVTCSAGQEADRPETGILILAIIALTTFRIIGFSRSKRWRKTRAQRLSMTAAVAPKADPVDEDGWVLVPRPPPKLRWIDQPRNRAQLLLWVWICIAIVISIVTLKEYRFITWL